MSLPRKRPPLEALTGLRFFAALHVVLHHYLITVPAYRQSAPPFVLRLMDAGPAAVTLFFVLSGFLLSYNYLQADGELRADKREFWAARFARLYPVYFLGIVVYAPIAITRYFSGTGLSVVDVGPGPAFWVSGVLTLFMLQAWTVVFLAWNGPCWSVSAEAFFYLIFPRSARYMTRLGLRRMAYVLAGLWLASLIGPLYWEFAVLGHSTKQVKELWDVTLTFSPLLRSIHFLAGIGFGIYFLRRPREGTARDGWLAAILATVCILAAGLVPSSAGRLFDNLMTPLFGALVYLLAFQRGPLCRFLSHPRIVLLGEASYAMYILHNPLWNYLARLQNIAMVLLNHHFPAGPAKPNIRTEWNYDMSAAMFCFYLATLVGVSILVLRYIEEPARRLLRRKLTERRPGFRVAEVSSVATQ